MCSDAEIAAARESTGDDPVKLILDLIGIQAGGFCAREL